MLVISIDGGHESDLVWFAQTHPQFAPLLQAAQQYVNAKAPIASDSYSGLVAQLTGGNSGTTGIYGAQTYDHALLPAGTTRCRGATAGAEVDYTGDLDLDKSAIDAGQGLTGLPASVLNMTGSPQRLIDRAKLPVDPKTCKPVYPNQFLKVNSVFDVAKASGLRTAWSGDHPAYSILDGRSGTGVDDLFTPEIASTATGYPKAADWTKDNAATRQYDNYKAQSIINEIDGYDHSRTTKVGAPAVFGLNFGSVASAQNLATSDGQPGGYQTVQGQTVPGPLLADSLTFVDTWVGEFVAELAAQGLTDSTAIFVSSATGQSPRESQDLTRVSDKPIIDGLNRAWAAGHPNARPLVAFSNDGDALQFWLSDHSARAADFAKKYLTGLSVTGLTATGANRTLSAAGTAKIYAGADAARLLGVSVRESRHPDLYASVQHGVVYNAPDGVIAGSGGIDPENQHVELLELLAGVAGTVQQKSVTTTQIAPTILGLLGLNPRALRAVRIDHTPSLIIP